MLDAVLGYIANNYPLIFIALALMFATFWITKKWLKHKSKIDSLEIACREIPSIHAKITSFESNLNNRMASVSHSINNLTIFLTSKHTDFNSSVFQSHSPIRITPLGMDILKQSGGENYVNSYLETLIDKMESQDFKSALDVQNYSTSLMMEELHTDEFISIRNYLFQNPVFRSSDKEIQLNAPSICNLMGVFLRDKYFEIHPELKDAE